MVFIKGQTPWPKCKKRGPMSQIQKDKISASKKGTKSWSKGLTKETDIRIKHMAEKTSLGKIGKPLPHMRGNQFFKGRHHNESTKLILSKQKLGNNWNMGRKFSKESIEKIKEKRKFQILPLKNTKPERFLQSILTINGIKFRTHEPITGQPDIFIEPNICVFVDGVYWHSTFQQVNRDTYVNRKLLESGHKVIRFEDDDIYYNVELVIEKIKSL